MKLLLSCLLLASLSALSSDGVPTAKFVVTQTPDVEVVEGKTVHIECCWNISITFGKVNWLKNQTQISNEAKIKTEILNDNRCLGAEKCNCSTLTLNITSNDTGRYVCKVSKDKPRLLQAQGDGTVITVKARQDAVEHDAASGGDQPESPVSPLLPLPAIVSLAVLLPLLLIVLIFFWTRHQRHGSERAAKVIYQTPHGNSEEAEVDGHSTSSSRGSSQWCQVAVYESVDYFERVESKGSG